MDSQSAVESKDQLNFEIGSRRTDPPRQDSDMDSQSAAETKQIDRTNVDVGSRTMIQSTFDSDNIQDSDLDTSLVAEPKPAEHWNFLELPLEIVEKVFSYLNYETVSKIRPVCKRINEVSSSLLNSAFQRLQALMLQRFQKIKAQMPRRESARRKHPLARESDIIETLHMRLTLLQMSFGKHIERKHCCFFAGEILDEVYRIMRYVKTTPSLARAYKVTDELFDLSTMAMEYFKERIEPTLPEITYFGTDFLDFNSFSTSSTKSCSWKLLDSPGSSASSSGSFNPSNSSDDVGETSQNTTTLKRKLRRFRQDMKRHNKRQASMFKDLKRCRSRLAEQEKQMKELSNRLEDFTKKNEGSASKLSAVLQELNKCKTELQYWRSKSPANSVCCLCGGVVAAGEVVRPDALGDRCAALPPDSASFELATKSDFIPIPDDSNYDNKSDADDETLPSESSLARPQPSSSSAVDTGAEHHRSKRKWDPLDESFAPTKPKRGKLQLVCGLSDGDAEVASLSSGLEDYQGN